MLRHDEDGATRVFTRPADESTSGTGHFSGRTRARPRDRSPFRHRQTGTGRAIWLLAQICPPCLVRQVVFEAGTGVRDQVAGIKLPDPDRVVLMHGDEALAVR